jgi:hypothetical protein
MWAYSPARSLACIGNAVCNYTAFWSHLMAVAACGVVSGNMRRGKAAAFAG